MSKSLYILRQVSKFLCKDSLKSLYFSFIHSHLLYCLPIWSCTAKCNLEGVIRIQKKAIRIISGSRYNAHTANLFKQLEILPLEQLILKMLYDHYHICTTSGFAAIGGWKGLPPSFKEKNRATFYPETGYVTGMAVKLKKICLGIIEQIRSTNTIFLAQYLYICINSKTYSWKVI